MAPQAVAIQVAPDTPIVIKLAYNGNNRKIRLPLADLTSQKLPLAVLGIAEDQQPIIERYSDSAGGWNVLDTANVATYKQLYRAAKVKLKLRMRVVLPTPALIEAPAANAPDVAAPEPKAPKVPPKEPLFEPLSTSELQIVLEKVPMLSVSEKPSTPVAPAAQTAGTGYTVSSIWKVFCNVCEKPTSDEHFHCNKCESGNYDLCVECVDNGHLCHDDQHWLIKRTIRNGQIVNSTTETVWPSNQRVKPEAVQKVEDIPNVQAKETAAQPLPAYTLESKGTVKQESPAPVRGCNRCIRTLPAHMFMNCTDCDDYDLCTACWAEDKHGHHPGHRFNPIDEDRFEGQVEGGRCGRSVRHPATCDGCDKPIFGARHKCLDCPDFDLCSSCLPEKQATHQHRFLPLYEPNLKALYTQAHATASTVRHSGIYCDGPLCLGKTHPTYIRGVRYKCTICHDTDFCSNCEAHPSNGHNASHPLIKMRTAIDHLSIETHEDGPGQRVHGDRNGRQCPYMNREMPVYESKASSEKTTRQAHVTKASAVPRDPAALNATFVSDRVADGTRIPPNTEFLQTFTLKNAGSVAWPKGCHLKQCGGDNMICLDRAKPVAVESLIAAQRSNVNHYAITENVEMDFTIKLRTPDISSGRLISYWRLCTPEGMQFGDKLWCDVTVDAHNDDFAELQKRLRADSRERVESTKQYLKMFAAEQIERAFAAMESADDSFSSSVGSYQHLSIPLNVSLLSKDTGIEHSARKIANNLLHMVAKVRKYNDHPHWSAADGASMREIHTTDVGLAISAARLALNMRERPVATQVEAAVLPERFARGAAASPANEFTDAAEALEGSDMIFPKLEKESPTSSTIKSTPAMPSAAAAAPAASVLASVVLSEAPSAASAAPPSTAGTETTAGDADLQAMLDDAEIVDSIQDDDADVHSHDDTDASDAASDFTMDDYDIVDPDEDEYN